jgi:ABC-type lipoprotein export system ATPase subunit/GNAT superfamily N-acetyltransferase
MKFDIEVASEVKRTPRVLQVEGLFDVPPMQRAQQTWHVDMPLEDKPWNVGLIVGPSGCGKSTIARKAFGDEMTFFENLRGMWARGDSLLDGFPKTMSIRDITDLLSNVGFSSPPSWVKPFDVLSNGEQFRVMMARLLAESQGKVAVADEFTSVVDRTVARVGSCAIARTVRKRNEKFVAVTCHEDVEEWLQPDWVFRPANQSFAWRSVQSRPKLQLTVFRAHHDAWKLFKQHHYLSAELNKSAACFVAFASFPEGPRLVAFDSWVHFPHAHIKSAKRGHRLVCLPDYQGLGIGQTLETFLASMWRGLGHRAIMGTAHPGLVASRRKDKRWKVTRDPSFSNVGGDAARNKSRAMDRLMASFEYVGPAMPREQAQSVHDNMIYV